MIEQRLASKLQLAVGRTVVLERDAHRFQARVAAIRSGALVMGETFVPIAFGQQILGLGQQVTGALLMATGTTGEIKREIYSLPWVSRVFMRQEVFAELLGTGEHLRAVIGVAGNLSIPLALLFVFASFSQTIMQRRREFGMLAVLGYSDSVIVSIVALEVWLLGAATVALAVPFAWFAASFLTWRLSTAWVAVDTVARAADFVRILGPTLVLLPLAAVPSIRSVLREPLPRILGGQRFG
jgi:ABC-type antimicrobial peptide transport system permease subunit